MYSSQDLNAALLGITATEWPLDVGIVYQVHLSVFMFVSLHKYSLNDCCAAPQRCLFNIPYIYIEHVIQQFTIVCDCTARQEIIVE